MGLLWGSTPQDDMKSLLIGSALLGGKTVGDQIGGIGPAMVPFMQAQQQKQDAAAQINKTVQFLQDKDPMLAQAVSTGTTSPSDAFAAYLRKQQAAAEAAKPKYSLQNINGKLVRVDMNSGQTDQLADYSQPKAPEYKSVGDMLFNTGTQEWVKPPADMASENDKSFDGRNKIAAKLGMDPNDPATKQYLATGKFPREDQQALTAVDKKAILEADEMVQVNQQAIDALKQAKTLSNSANSGILAGTRATIGANLPDMLVPDQLSSPDSSTATLDYDNAIVGQALGQLKAIFGGAPTEGERKILLDLQGSANQPAAVRERILDRAIAMAEKRLEFNKSRADELRGGTYYKPDKAQQNNAGTTSSGINWSAEQ